MKQHRLNIMKLSTPLLPDPGGEAVLECIREIERLQDVLELIASDYSKLEYALRNLARAALDARY